MMSFFESWVFVVLLFVLVFGGWAIGLWYEAFYAIWWLDIPFHFAGGVLVLVIAWVSFRTAGVDVSGGILAKFIIMLGIVMLVGVFWEFTEFVADRFVLHTGATYLPGVFEDTLADLLFDFFGGAFGFLTYSLLITNSYKYTNNLNGK